MQSFKILTRAGFGAAVLASCCLPKLAIGQDQVAAAPTATVTKPLTEPVFRVAGRRNDTSAIKTAPAIETAPAETRDERNPARVPTILDFDSKSASPAQPAVVAHPLDRALAFSHEALAAMRSNVYDYTARMAKSERIKGTLTKMSYMDIKIRCPRETSQGQQTPFSIYMKFLQPRDASGREVLWIDGRYNGNLLAHQPGVVVGLRTFELPPTGMMAMQGQRYPIYEAGLENLIVKLIEKATRDRAAGMCEVNYRDGLKMNHRPCSLIEVVHREKRAPYEFYKAQVLIDNELNLPVRYTAYDWPKAPGAKPEILEQYSYVNIKLNVGLTDKDFDPSNSAYNFPGR